jgi:hypothetical protein
MQFGLHFRRIPRVHVVQAFCDRISLLALQKLRDRFCIQSTSRNPKATGNRFRPAEKVVRHRDGGLHISQSNPSYTRALSVESILAVSSPGRTSARARSRRRRTAGCECQFGATNSVADFGYGERTKDDRNFTNAFSNGFDDLRRRKLPPFSCNQDAGVEN